MTEYIEKAAALAACRHAWAKGLEPSQYVDEIDPAPVVPISEGLRMVLPGDKDYPFMAMVTVENRDKYTIFKAGGLDLVPLFQVLDLMETIRPDYIVRDGVRYCPNCGAPMEREAEP